MRIEVHCPCGQSYAANPEALGREIQCGKCGNWYLAVPNSNPQTKPSANPQIAAVDKSVSAEATANHRRNATRIRQSLVICGGLSFLLILAATLLVPALFSLFRKIQSDVELAWTPSPKSWKTHTSQVGNFSIDLPGIPQDIVSTEMSAHGQAAFQGVSLEVPNAIFGVGYVEFPANTDFSDWSIRAMRAMNSKYRALFNFNGITANGMHGIELWGTGETPNGPSVIQSRMYLVKSRLYEITWIGRPGKKPGGEVQRYFDSFRLLKSVGDQGRIKAFSEWTEEQRKSVYLAFLNLSNGIVDTSRVKGDLAVRYKISVTELDRIIHEGEHNRWK